MARAAARWRVPLVLLEQNAIPGKATRWLARRAALICTAFEETGGLLRCRCPIRVTGNPVRAGFRAISRNQRKGMLEPRDDAQVSPPSALPLPPSQLLVLGGSGGARSLNENVPRALYKIRGQLAGWKIVHQSGESDLDATRTLYAKLDLPATVVPFLERHAGGAGGDRSGRLPGRRHDAGRIGGRGGPGDPAALSARHRRSPGGQRPALCRRRRLHYNRRARRARPARRSTGRDAMFPAGQRRAAEADVGGHVRVGPAQRRRRRGRVDLVDRQQPIASDRSWRALA